MKTIGIVTDRENKSLSASDRLLVEPLGDYGFKAGAAVWEDKNTEWKKYDMLILRSCWNYHENYDKWLEWLDVMSQTKVKVLNPIEVLRWNSHKSYLLDLIKKGVKVVPTRLIKAGQETDLTEMAVNFRSKELIIKPAVGASSTNIKKVTGSNVSFEFDQDMLIQPFVPEVSRGELSLIFINRKLSHTIIKIPENGDYRTHPKYGGREELIKAPDDIRIQAERVLEAVEQPLLYARVDGVMEGTIFRLMELELIEPHLFFDLYPDGAKTMAQAIHELN